MAPRAPGADPRTAHPSGIPSLFGTLLGIAVFIGMFWDFLTQTFVLLQVMYESFPQVVDEIVDSV